VVVGFETTSIARSQLKLRRRYSRNLKIPLEKFLATPLSLSFQKLRFATSSTQISFKINVPLYCRIIEHRTRNNHFGDLAAFHVFQLIFNKGTTRAMCDVLRQWMCDKKCGKSKGEELEKMNERCNFQLYDFPSIYFFVMWQKKYSICIAFEFFFLSYICWIIISYKLSGMSNAEIYPPEKGKEKKKFESKHKLNENLPYTRYRMSVYIYFLSNIQTALPFSVYFLIHK